MKRQLGETMATGRNSARSTARYTKNEYIYGNAVKRQLEEVPARRSTKSHAQRRNRERARHMNVGYLFFLGIAMIAVGFVLISYLTLKSDITNSVKNIARMESELNALRLDNDERETRISSGTSLDDVKQKAIKELGMQYAAEGQIITFNSEESDYVIQKGDIPD